ncbi:MAG: hypothetical protein ACFFE3_00360 [Candidatus Thorarchaeota archaeon]
MAPEKRGNKNIKGTPLSKLLDDFVDTETVPEDRTHADMSDEEYIEMMIKKEAKRKLLRVKHEASMTERIEIAVDDNGEIPEIPEGSCPSCYYCTIIRRIGSNVYCVCANPERVIEGMYYDYRIWVRSEPDLDCHRESPARKVQKFVRQQTEDNQTQPDSNIPIELVPGDDKPILTKLDMLNLVDDKMELVEFVDDGSVVEDTVVPELKIRPPEKPRIDLEMETKIVETQIPDEFSETPNQAVETLFREETIAAYKHKALETLKKYKKERPLDLKKSEEMPIISEKRSQMRKCDTCYFCVDDKRIGGSSWVHCTNISRSVDTVTAASWVRSRLNAACWKRPESL